MLGSPELHVIENIEHLHTELRGNAFRYLLSFISAISTCQAFSARMRPFGACQIGLPGRKSGHVKYR